MTNNIVQISDHQRAAEVAEVHNTVALFEETLKACLEACVEQLDDIDATGFSADCFLERCANIGKAVRDPAE